MNDRPTGGTSASTAEIASGVVIYAVGVALLTLAFTLSSRLRQGRTSAYPA